MWLDRSNAPQQLTILPMCSLFFTTLSSHHVNELLARFCSFCSHRNGSSACLNFCIRQRSYQLIVDNMQLTICQPPYSTIPANPFQLFNNPNKLVCLLIPNSFVDPFVNCQLTPLSTLSPPVENNGFEPLTPCLQSRCSSQLS